MPTDSLEQTNEDPESSRCESVSEPASADEEAVYKKLTKFKPKLVANYEASTVSTFHVVEGRKKFIALLCVSCIGLVFIRCRLVY